MRKLLVALVLPGLAVGAFVAGARFGQVSRSGPSQRVVATPKPPPFVPAPPTPPPAGVPDPQRTSRPAGTSGSLTLGEAASAFSAGQPLAGAGTAVYRPDLSGMCPDGHDVAVVDPNRGLICLSPKFRVG